MSHIHVCLVSDQTIPNILSVSHFKPDELLFITTEDMERKGKTAAIVATLGLMGLDYGSKAAKIIVKEDSILDLHKKIDEWIRGKEVTTFVLNLTCGTKIMSIAAYEYFKDYSSKMIYVPIPKNAFIVPFPKKSPGNPTPLALRLDVVSYLSAYGLKVLNAKKLVGHHNEAVRRRDMSRWIVEHYDRVKPLLERFSEKLRKHRDDREGFELTFSYQSHNTEEKELITAIGFSRAGDAYTKRLNKSEIGYLTGGWLEEFCYNELLEFSGKGLDDVVLGIIPQKEKTKNEFDIMFTKDNALFTVECKSLDQKDDKKTEALYKIAALQKDFGLRAESFFVSTSPYIMKDGALRWGVQARAEQFNTTVVPPYEVIHFGNKVSEKLKLGRADGKL